MNAQHISKRNVNVNLSQLIERNTYTMNANRRYHYSELWFSAQLVIFVCKMISAAWISTYGSLNPFSAWILLAFTVGLAMLIFLAECRSPCDVTSNSPPPLVDPHGCSHRATNRFIIKLVAWFTSFHLRISLLDFRI